jgi:hypothetical protein
MNQQKYLDKIQVPMGASSIFYIQANLLAQERSHFWNNSPASI